MMVSTRAFGTGLPLTTAMFWAWASGATTAASTMLAAKMLFFMNVPFGRGGSCGSKGAEAPARLARARCSARRRGAGVDGDGVDAAGHQGVQGIIYEAVAGHPREAFEASAADRDAEMRSLACAGVTGVPGAVVHDGDRFGRQRGAQRRLDVAGRDAHRVSGPVPDASSDASSSFR